MPKTIKAHLKEDHIMLILHLQLIIQYKNITTRIENTIKAFEELSRVLSVL